MTDSLEVLIVDDHAIVREGLARILLACGHPWRVSEAATGFQALDRVRAGGVDVVIVDMSMPGMSGLELIHRLHADHTDVAVLVLSMHAEEQYALRAFRAGANGYLTKDRAGIELVAAVCKVAGGGAYVTASLAEQMVLGMHGGASAPPGPEQLSDREFEVLRRIVAGQPPGEIAEELHLSVKTVSTHKRRILDKLGLNSTAALIRYGMEHGIPVN